MELISQLSDRLLFAIPKKGRLHEHCISLLEGADITFHRNNRLDIALVHNLPIAIVFLPAADIAKFVGEGNVDLGITGQDIIAESQMSSKVEVILELGFGKCKLQVQAPVRNQIKDVKELVGKRIVTSFEDLVANYFGELDKQYLSEEERAAGKKTMIQYVSGSVEAACALGLADGIESGETMRAAGLEPISTILTTQAILIKNNHSTNLSLVNLITSRIKGVIAAKKYVLLSYNIKRIKLKLATKITPGRKAPTISPLEDGEWIEIQSMVCKDEVADIMDKLEEIGARDILVFKVDNCRV
ncbi:23789_t:CDS:2 [Entrophospora sp. SA101]|nr:13743_t:CDS:2 [Entrophospora candida]CAJ0744981.1 17376_t:CDS:2 [Entrophospora sp. SA101]CAJ0754992.1 23789_t:CDS:2 [Entrophospora sp. SA101]CAJ0839331.1 14541_t:CDS:2 [Entrophospora sp. SA101]CAJ0846787.1 18678_t:CDS:2 [Entrophospora sp. SA101]